MSLGQFARRKNWTGGDMTASSVDEDIRNLRLTLGNSNNIQLAANVLDFGARGDGVHDDTKAIQMAITTGRSVYIPPVADPTTQFYSINASLVLSSNQKIFGAGYSSVIKQLTNNLAVLSATTKSSITIDGLQLYATGTSSSTGDGAGVYLSGCSNCTVSNCFIVNPGSAGIFVFNSNYNTVFNNRFITRGSYSPPIQETDIYCYGSSSANLILGNVHGTGGASGIFVQTTGSGTDVANDNIIMGNLIDTYNRYGIIIYKAGAGDQLLRNKIIGNSVQNISGTSSDDGGTTKPFGAGIYLQYAEYTEVIGNTINSTNTSTNNDGLAPGGIGTTNCSSFVISGNTITNASWYGITCRDPNVLGISTALGIVSNNNVRVTTKDAITVVERGRMEIIGNTIETGTVRGIYVNNTSTQRYLMSIIGNTINTVSHNGIDVNFCSNVTISDNNIYAQALTGIIVGNCSLVTINDNIVNNNSSATNSQGIQISSSVTSPGIIVSDNIITNNQFGLVSNAQCRLADNDIFSNTTNTTGSWCEYRTLTVNNTGPSVQEGHTFVTANTSPTAYTSFTNGQDGQEIIILVQDTNTTFTFVATHLKGNGGVNFTPTNGRSSVRCVYNASDTNWYCVVSL